jgi:hypothetical protein
LVSITIGWPRICDTRWRTTRLTVSDALPAGNGLMTLIGRLGQSSAFADVAVARRNTPRAAVNGRSESTKTSKAF